MCDTNVLQMTFDEYDEMTELFDKITIQPFWPTLEEIDYFSEDPLRWIQFACFLYEKGTPPKNNAEKYSKKNLFSFIQQHLALIDTEED